MVASDTVNTGAKCRNQCISTVVPVAVDLGVTNTAAAYSCRHYEFGSIAPHAAPVRTPHVWWMSSAPPKARRRHRRRARTRSDPGPITVLSPSQVRNVVAVGSTPHPRQSAQDSPPTAPVPAPPTTAASPTVRFVDTAIGQMFAKMAQSERRARPSTPDGSPASLRVTATRKTPSPVTSAALVALQQDDEWVEPTPGADTDVLVPESPGWSESPIVPSPSGFYFTESDWASSATEGEVGSTTPVVDMLATAPAKQEASQRGSGGRSSEERQQQAIDMCARGIVRVRELTATQTAELGAYASRPDWYVCTRCGYSSERPHRMLQEGERCHLPCLGSPVAREGNTGSKKLVSTKQAAAEAELVGTMLPMLPVSVVACLVSGTRWVQIKVHCAIVLNRRRVDVACKLPRSAVVWNPWGGIIPDRRLARHPLLRTAARDPRAGPTGAKGWCTLGAGQVAHSGPAASHPWKWDHGRAKIPGSSVRGRAHDIAPAGRLGDVRLQPHGILQIFTWRLGWHPTCRHGWLQGVAGERG